MVMAMIVAALVAVAGAAWYFYPAATPKTRPRKSQYFSHTFGSNEPVKQKPIEPPEPK